MIIGLGLDLVESYRAAASYRRWGEKLVAKLMDPEEAERLGQLAAERSLAIAMSIALKEAGSKAIGTGWSRGVRWRDVIVETRPVLHVRLENRAAQVARRLGSSGRTHALVERRQDLVLAEVRLLS
jgi:holo-[acyl-carrier protein] synthase